MPMDADIQLPDDLALTSNLIWFDSLIRHQVFTIRMSGSIRNEIIKILNATEKEIAMLIRDRLQANRDDVPRRLLRSKRLIADIRDIRQKAWREIERLWINTYQKFTQGEIRFLQGAFEASVPVIVATAGVAIATTNAIVKNHVFEGRTISGWATNARQADIRRIDAQIKIGIAQGEASGNIARRVVGSARLRGRDGATQIARRNAETITRTATTAFGSASEQAFLAENERFFNKEIFVAILDSGTTPICRATDGTIYSIGEGLFPPLHHSCRSIRIPVIAESVIGSRPFKATSERILVRDYARENNLGRISSRANLPRGHKGRFDRFARIQGRKFIGTVPGKVNYNDWLTRQSKVFQDDVLGKTRAILFREGGLTLDRFVSRTGDNIPLWALARSDAAAFRAAGLDPGDFLPPAR